MVPGPIKSIAAVRYCPSSHRLVFPTERTAPQTSAAIELSIFLLSKFCVCSQLNLSLALSSSLRAGGGLFLLSFARRRRRLFLSG